MDIFGFNNQGINYDKFRPRYPKSMIENALAHTKYKGKYLDIATGTGYLLFQIAPYFLYSKGIDISKKMLDTATKKKIQFITKYPQNNLDLELRGIMESSQQQKYDLITVGQALHYFPKLEPMQKVKNMLQKDGIFVTYGYIFHKVVSKNQHQGEIFNRFYSKVKPYFTFNREELHNHYSDKILYPFEEVFPKVQRQLVQVPLEMNKLEYLSYLKTMSGYNLYLEKTLEDPLLEVQKNCAEEITIFMEYFSITCMQS